VLEFLSNNWKFLILIFEPLNLKENGKVARISEGYDDWIDEISANFKFVRESG
jgi:hypothetical protein